MSGNVIRDKSFQFALDVIKLYKQLTAVKEFALSKQLLRSGTSIGANVEEAGEAQSRKDFTSKMNIALKEARETCYWLRLLQESDLVKLDFRRELASAEELVRILASIVKTTKETPPPDP